ncbi:MULTISPECIES: hypothetical protein [unclassified Bradyrhizobium]|uniref:hypothetical protein n=1 Tax=unclassified Bradyrhizobium TaxID=2631580 RepID=UPI001FF9E3AE|nr:MULTISPECIES: hypothetical protein [unclassified Bradyrhizobium]MCK1714156.1 hypothetical protein [Bradyrhizobium sp. 143]MCK1725247.1 hypothetical protein [Bradyrhizobium sp. 142]
MSCQPTFSETHLKEIAADISLEVSWAIQAIFRAHGIGTYEVDTFHKPTLKALGRKVLKLAEAEFNALFK